MLKVAVFVSGNGSNLEALLRKKLRGGQIALVVSSNPSAYALLRAKSHQIPTQTLCRKDFFSQREFEEELLELLRKYQIDCIVLAGFMLILSPFFIQFFPKRIINVHPSLIPSFCGEGFYGIRVHQAVLDYGVKVSGASVHFVNEVVDGGEIIAQKAINLSKNETPQSLQKKIIKLEHQILPKALQTLISQIKKEKHGK